MLETYAEASTTSTEPPVGSVVLDPDGFAWQRDPTHADLWVRTGSRRGITWKSLTAHHCPLTVIHLAGSE